MQLSKTSIADQLNNAVFYGLCVFVVLMPIPLGGNRIWAQALLQLALSVLVVLQLSASLVQPVPRFAVPRLLWLVPLLAMTLYTALQPWLLATSDMIDVGAAHVSLSKAMMYSAFALLLSVQLHSYSRFKQVLWAVVISGSVQAFYAITLQLLALKTTPFIAMDEHNVARGSFVYQNHFANYMLLCIAAGIGLLLSELSSRKVQRNWRQVSRVFIDTVLSKKLIIRLCLVLMVIGLVMSHSRMGNAAFFTSLLTLSAIALLGGYKRPPVFFKFLIVSILVLDVIVIGSMFGIEKLQQRYEETSFRSEARDDVSLDSLALIQQHPWSGTGAGSFYSAFPSSQTQLYHGFYDHAHNDYIQFAIEYGMPVTVLLLCWLVILAVRFFNTMRNHEHKLARGCSFAALMAMIAMALHCSVDFNLQAPANALLFITLLALAWNISTISPKTTPPSD